MSIAEQRPNPGPAFNPFAMHQPYHPEYTPSRPIREVKLDWARLSDRPGTSSVDVFVALAHNHAFGAASKAHACRLGPKRHSHLLPQMWQNGAIRCAKMCM